MADTLREAFRFAKSGRPGPVLLMFQKTFTFANRVFTPARTVEKTPDKKPDKTLMAQAVEMLKEANAPLIYCVAAYITQIAANTFSLAEKLDAYVTFSMMGLTAMDGENFRYLA